MTAWIAAVLAVAVGGTSLWRLQAVRDLDLPARLTVAFVGGTVWVTLLMFLASAAGLPWNPLWLFPLIVLPAIFTRGGIGGAAVPLLTASGVTAASLLTLYGTLTARETCADLIYFWGPKAARFARVRAIDVDYLGHPEHLLMHPDYPPLVPLLYGWGAMVAGELDFWGPLVLTTFLLAGTALFVRGTASDSGALTMAFVLAYAYAQSLAAGAADPMLVLFEVVALCALAFLRDRPGGAWVASVALTAAVLTKVEGAAFAATALLSYLLLTRRVRQAVVMAVFPALALGSWILFARSHGLLDSYARGGSPLRMEAAPEVISGLARASAYHLFFLPWIAALAPLLTRRPPLREAALPLMVMAGALAYTAFFYLHSPDPASWIAWSGERVLLTPLAAAVVAGAAAGRARAAPVDAS